MRERGGAIGENNSVRFAWVLDQEPGELASVRFAQRNEASSSDCRCRLGLSTHAVTDTEKHPPLQQRTSIGMLQLYLQGNDGGKAALSCITARVSSAGQPMNRPAVEIQ